MSRIDEHELRAWVDGELAPADAARVAAAVAADPELSRRAERERHLRTRLRAAFDPVLDEPAPPHLLSMLQAGDGARVDAPTGPSRGSQDSTGRVVPLHRDRGRGAPRRWSVPVYALAASLMVLAVSLWLRPGSGPVRLDDSALVAHGELADALDTALAATPDADGRFAVGVTFRAADGHVCRSFVRRERPALAGLACREGARWTLPVLARPDAPDAGGELRQAANAMPPEVQAAIDARLEGDTFDAAQERAARAAGWR